MYPPVFQYATSSEAVRTYLGVNPTRLWPFDKAPQNEQRTYAVHQLIYGTPENSMSCPPGIDLYGLQFDIYGKTATETRTAADALVGAMEVHGHVVAFNGENVEAQTGLYRVSFTAEFWTPRT